MIEKEVFFFIVVVKKVGFTVNLVVTKNSDGLQHVIFVDGREQKSCFCYC